MSSCRPYLGLSFISISVCVWVCVGVCVWGCVWWWRVCVCVCVCGCLGCVWLCVCVCVRVCASSCLYLTAAKDFCFIPSLVLPSPVSHLLQSLSLFLSLTSFLYSSCT